MCSKEYVRAQEVIHTEEQKDEMTAVVYHFAGWREIRLVRYLIRGILTVVVILLFTVVPLVLARAHTGPSRAVSEQDGIDLWHFVHTFHDSLLSLTDGLHDRLAKASGRVTRDFFTGCTYNSFTVFMVVDCWIFFFRDAWVSQHFVMVGVLYMVSSSCFWLPVPVGYLEDGIHIRGTGFFSLLLASTCLVYHHVMTYFPSVVMSVVGVSMVLLVSMYQLCMRHHYTVDLIGAVFASFVAVRVGNCVRKHCSTAVTDTWMHKGQHDGFRPI
jgi:hypothetical protein